jgi:16S rRNA (cytidine1402-2'-O)-methyltransferase
MAKSLYIVATPIGNLQDITFRAIEVLKSVDVIAAEDTRHSRALLQHFGIQTPLISLHDHNERDESASILQRIKSGQSVALISDAGTPLISDPGYYLVKLAHEQDIKVVPIPGASALITALSASGLPSDRFMFEGFLSAKASARRTQLESLKKTTQTMIFYEAPHRILDTITDMKVIFGEERRVCIARELTKTFETIHIASLHNIQLWLQQDLNQQKGEFVILVSGYIAPEEDQVSPEAERILAILLEELPLKTAAKLTAKITGAKKNMLYNKHLPSKRFNHVPD